MTDAYRDFWTTPLAIAALRLIHLRQSEEGYEGHEGVIGAIVVLVLIGGMTGSGRGADWG